MAAVAGALPAAGLAAPPESRVGALESAGAGAAGAADEADGGAWPISVGAEKSSPVGTIVPQSGHTLVPAGIGMPQARQAVDIALVKGPHPGEAG